MAGQEGKLNLLSSWRFRATSMTDRTLSIEASSDRSRIVFCEAFRQLHRKAQVFSLEAAGSARTRLTHSLEVAQIGRYLTQVFFDVANNAVLRGYDLEGCSDIVQSFVESACLVHDIGNPPFGHFGELAIRHWFERNMEALEKAWCGGAVKKKQAFEPLMRDFTAFDGNPQGFRILTRLMWGTDKFSLNLTATQLASCVKYNVPPMGVQPGDSIRKKPGYFSSEAKIAADVFGRLGISEGRRHPFAYLMEAADDIAYCLSDIEDAIHKGLVSEADFLDEISGRVSSETAFTEFAEFVPEKVDGKYSRGAYLLFRVRCINKIVRLAADDFCTAHAGYFAGTRSPILDNVAPARSLLEYIKSVARERIYDSSLVLRNELIGAKVITGILDAFFPLMTASRERFSAVVAGESKDSGGNHISSEKALLRQVPENLLLAYESATVDEGRVDDLAEHFARAHLVVDFLSGLTDGQAVDAHKLLCAG